MTDSLDGSGVERAVGIDASRSKAAFEALAPAEGAAVVHVAFELDVEVTPLSAYAALSAADDYAVLLESAEKTPSSDPAGAFGGADPARHARYSFVVCDPAAVVSVTGGASELVDCRDERVAGLGSFGDGGATAADASGDGDTFDALRAAMPDVEPRGFPDHDRQVLEGGLVGALAYEAVYDAWLDGGPVDRPAGEVPDALFAVADRTLVFDAATGSVTLVSTPLVTPADDAGERYADAREAATRIARQLAAAETVEAGEDPLESGGVRVDERREVGGHGSDAAGRAAYEDAVVAVGELVESGEVYQAVVSRARELLGEFDPVAVYQALRAVNPSPYMYCATFGDRHLVGASPETLVSVSDGTVGVNPIAGTIERGATPVEDRRLAGELLADPKERAEHAMLVDLARNDVRRVARQGSVAVGEFMAVLKYSHVQHIESTVTGRLAPDADTFDAIRAGFPAGTVTGAPKVRAMEHLRRLESGARGWYAGAIGYVSWTGDADTAIVIRSATIAPDEADADRQRLRVRAGAGVVADSDPAAEYEETDRKLAGVLAAVERAAEESR